MSVVNALYEEMGLTRIVEIDPKGRAVLEYEAKPAQCHSGGVVQGGFVTGWIDAAMAHAAIALTGDQIVPMTLEKAIEYIGSDEYVKITPQTVRLRKKYLTENERKRAGR